MKSKGHTPGAVVTGVTSGFGLVSYICVALRLWTRLKVQRQPGVDDYLIIVAACFNVVMNLTMAMQVKYGLSQHIWTINPDDLENMMFWFWLSIWNYYCAQGFAKLSISAQYLRIFGHVVTFRRVCYGAIALSGFYTLWGIVTSILMCVPIPGFWHLDWQKNGKARRMPTWKVLQRSAEHDDRPPHRLHPPARDQNLNLPRKQRYMLMGVFCLGGLVCIISIVRLSGLYAIAVSHDPSYDNCLAALWSTTEANLTVIASCLPVIKGFLNQHFPRLFKPSIAGTADRYNSSLSGPSHSQLKDTDTFGSNAANRGIWGKKMTEIGVEETEVGGSSSNGSPGGTGKSEAWGWSENGQGPGGPEVINGIQMHPVVGRTSSKTKNSLLGASAGRKLSDESHEALVRPSMHSEK